MEWVRNMRWSHRSDLTVENGLDERSGKCEFKFVDRFMLWIWIFWTRSHFSVQVCNYKYIPNSDISRLDNRCMIQIRLMKANYQSIPFIPDFFFKIKLKSKLKKKKKKQKKLICTEHITSYFYILIDFFTNFSTISRFFYHSMLTLT